MIAAPEEGLLEGDLLESPIVADAQSFAAANCATRSGAMCPEAAAAATAALVDVVEEVEDTGVAAVDDLVVAAVAAAANAAVLVAFDAAIRVKLEIPEVPLAVEHEAVGVALANAAISSRCLYRRS